MAKKEEIKKKLQFQRIVITVLAIVFLVFMALSFLIHESWPVLGAMISVFILVDYLFIVIFFNGNASKKKGK